MRRSSASRSRAPASSTRSSATGAKAAKELATARQQRPTRVASAVPSKKPEGEVSGVLKSACASSHSTPASGPSAATEPSAA